jgi:hypothetical protein
MPTTASFSNTQNFTIPEDVYSMRIRVYGAGGGGEFIGTSATLPSTAGTNGTSSSFLGLVAGGGVGGGVGGKNQGGQGGTTSLSYNWSNLGASITTANGSSGTLSNGGSGGNIAGITRNGGNATPGQVSYTSSSTHFFNNDTNQHDFSSSGASADINVNYINQNAPDGLPCGTISYGKYYYISFVVPFVDSSYSVSVFGICQQAAGGGTATPYYSAGIDGKTRFGFGIWFCNGRAKNGYIRCFSFTATGLKEGARGLGGGGGAAIETTLSRNMLLGSGGTYSPGTTHTVTIGTGGTRGGNTASNGASGYVELFMYIIPRINLTATRTAIAAGESATLTWSTTGDADSITWSSGGLTNGNLTSNATVSPSVSTTYTATASGLGGTSPEASIRITVYQRPTASITAPVSLDYGVQGTVSYETQYANTSITITPTYSYDNGVVTGSVINLSAALSAESGAAGTISSGSFTTSIPYNNYGPRQVQYTLVATGSGGGISPPVTLTTINIDEIPENINIPETEDAFKEQDPVNAPDYDVTSNYLEVLDIDIPVEIKSSKPIKVDLNRQENWQDVRSL